MNKTQHEIICNQQGEIAQLTKERDSLQTQRDQVLHLLSGGTLTEQQVSESGLGIGVLLEQRHHEYMRCKAEKERDEAQSEARLLLNQCDALRRELVSHREKAQGNYWAWQDDEASNYLETLSAPVLIHPADLQKIVKERDEAQAKLKLFEDWPHCDEELEDGTTCNCPLQDCGEGIGYRCPVCTVRDQHDDALAKCNQLDAQIATLKESRAVAVEQEQVSRNECNRLRAACAEMHRALTECVRQCDYQPALKDFSDCGKDWKSPEEYAALEAKVAEMRDAIEFTLEASGDPDADRLPEAIDKLQCALSNCGKGYIPQDSQIKFPDNLSALTVGLVLKFAQAMAEKLSASEIKHGHCDAWAQTTHKWPIPECNEALMSHLKKGDPVDVANFCAFLWYHKISTSDCGYIPVSELERWVRHRLAGVIPDKQLQAFVINAAAELDRLQALKEGK